MELPRAAHTRWVEEDARVAHRDRAPILAIAAGRSRAPPRRGATYLADWLTIGLATAARTTGMSASASGATTFLRANARAM